MVVGASHAAVQAIDTLHREGHDGPIILVGDESEPPYNRPPLSKKYFTGELARERLRLRSGQFYQQGATSMRLGLRATAIDRRARRLDVAGADLPGIHYLRTIADVDAIRASLEGARRLVVVGAGYIGLEAAASARHLGLEVTVLEAADRPMQRVVCPALSEFYRARHEREGVPIHCNVAVTGFTGEARVRGVVCGKQEFPADVVIVGVGIAPDVTLAAAAGLKCDNGIWVDESCRTSDPNVYAAGDCTNHPSVHYGRRIRLESVDNAVEQGRVAGASLCGKDARHDHVPWFWSDQYDVKLQIVGLSQGHDETVVRGEPASGHFAIYYLLQGELIAVDAVNSPKDFMSGRRWIAERRHPDPVKLADPGVDLKSF